MEFTVIRICFYVALPHVEIIVMTPLGSIQSLFAIHDDFAAAKAVRNPQVAETPWESLTNDVVAVAADKIALQFPQVTGATVILDVPPPAPSPGTEEPA